MQFHSQDNQDLFLETYVFKGLRKGVFMDIGAHDGITINNTLFFSQQRDWSGVNVEPLPTVYTQLVNNRPNDININCAVCNYNGTAPFLSNSGYTEMLSGLKTYYDPRHTQRLNMENVTMNGHTDTITVTTKTIETICDELNLKHINYLSVDVEGAEFEVIQSINFDKVFIDVIGFENNYPDVGDVIIKYLQSKNYKVIYQCMDVFMLHADSPFGKMIQQN